MAGAQPRKDKPHSLWVRRRDDIDAFCLEAIAAHLSQDRFAAWSANPDTIAARRAALLEGGKAPKFQSKNNANATRMKAALHALHQIIGNHTSRTATHEEIAAKMCGCSNDTVVRAIRDLEDASLIEKTARQHPRWTKKGGGTGPCEYTIAWANLRRRARELTGVEVLFVDEGPNDALAAERSRPDERSGGHHELGGRDSAAMHEAKQVLGEDRTRPDERSGEPEAAESDSQTLAACRSRPDERSGAFGLVYVESRRARPSPPHIGGSLPHAGLSTPHKGIEEPHGAGSKPHSAVAKTHGAGSIEDCAGSIAGTPRAPARAREFLKQSKENNPSSSLSSLNRTLFPDEPERGGGGFPRWPYEEWRRICLRFEGLGVKCVRSIAREAQQGGWSPGQVHWLIDWWIASPAINGVRAYPLESLCKTFQESLPCEQIPFAPADSFTREKREQELAAKRARDAAAALKEREQREAEKRERQAEKSALEGKYGPLLDQLSRSELDQLCEAIRLSSVEREAYARKQDLGLARFKLLKALCDRDQVTSIAGQLAAAFSVPRVEKRP